MDLQKQIKSDKLHMFLSYWNELVQSASGAIPRRKALDPTRIPLALANVWIYEKMEHGGFECLLSGDRIRVAWSTPTKRRTLRDIIGHEDYAYVEKRFNRAISEELLIHSYSHSAGERNVHTAERLYGPMRGEDEGQRFIFGVSLYETLEGETRKQALDSITFGAVNAYCAKQLKFRGPVA